MTASRMQDAALRIAAALEDVTINGRSDAPPDAKWLHEKYLDYRES